MIKTIILLFFMSLFCVNVYACPTLSYAYCDSSGKLIKYINTATFYHFASPECATRLSHVVAWRERPENTFYLVYTGGGDWFFGTWTTGDYENIYAGRGKQNRVQEIIEEFSPGYTNASWSHPLCTN